MYTIRASALFHESGDEDDRHFGSFPTYERARKLADEWQDLADQVIETRWGDDPPFILVFSPRRLHSARGWNPVTNLISEWGDLS